MKRIFKIVPVVLLIATGAFITVHFLAGPDGNGPWKRTRTEMYRFSIYHKRGTIYDCHGTVLAYSGYVYEIGIDCTRLDEKDWEEGSRDLAPCLAGLFPEHDATGWLQELQKGRAEGSTYLPIAWRASEETAEQVRTFPIFESPRSGGILARRIDRLYPYGILARATVGFAHADSVRIGLERRFDRILSETHGLQVVKSGMRRGEIVSKTVEMDPGRDGMDLHTTLSVPLQAKADSVLRDVFRKNRHVASGVLVLMESGGAVRAVVNLTRTDDGHVFEIIDEDIQRTACLPFDPPVSSVSEEDSCEPPVSPLKVLAWWNAMAFRGRMVDPYLVEEISDQGGSSVRHDPVRTQMIPEDVADSLAHRFIQGAGNGSGETAANRSQRIAGASGVRRSTVTYCGFSSAGGQGWSVVCALRFSRMDSRSAVLPESAARAILCTP